MPKFIVDSERLLTHLGLALLEQMSVGVVAKLNGASPKQVVYYANKAAQRLLHLPSQSPSSQVLDAIPFTIDPELVGTSSIKRPLHPPLKAAFELPGIERRDLALHGRPISIEGQSIHCDDQVFHVILLFERDHRLFVQQRHTTDLLTSEVSLKDMIAFDKLVSQLSTALINANLKDAQLHIQNALGALGKFCQADRTYIFEFDSDYNAMSNTYEWVRDGITSHIDELQNMSRYTVPWFFHKLQSEGLFIINDVQNIPNEGKAERDEFNNENICSVLCVGMYIQQRLVGLVGCDMVARHRHWTEADIRRLKIVGEIITSALQKQHYIHSLQATQKELIQANTTLQHLAQRDSLTGLANRRHFDDMLTKELARAQRHQTPLCLVLFDIDFFKPYNDHYGHLAGDKVLQQVANKLTAQFRRSGELVARFGGEEFTVIIPGMTIAQAQEQVSAVLEKLCAAAIEHQDSPHNKRLTMSAGIACYNAAHPMSSDDLINNADQALYKAKEAGRNCTRIKESYG